MKEIWEELSNHKGVMQISNEDILLCLSLCICFFFVVFLLRFLSLLGTVSSKEHSLSPPSASSSSSSSSTTSSSSTALTSHSRYLSNAELQEGTVFLASPQEEEKEKHPSPLFSRVVYPRIHLQIHYAFSAVCFFVAIVSLSLSLFFSCL